MKTKKRKTNKNKNKTKKKFEFSKCSPLSGNKSYTCYNSEQLIKLKNIWNSRRPDKKIDENDPRAIWNKIRVHLQNSCNRESCWLRQNIFKLGLDKKMLNVFAPLRPKEWDKNKNEWLTGDDIEKVMKQYEKKYPNFDFIGPTPIDYDTIESYGICVWEELCKFDLKKIMKRGKNKVGIIFNLDKHTGPGSHWISLFIDLTSSSIFFFDSASIYVPSQIKKLINNIKTQKLLINKNMPFKVYLNKIEHQKKNSECGVYSLYFIINMLTKKKSWEDFQKERINDDYVSQFRDIYFNNKL
tara:strand:+ start:9472 stop:10365 length:894 start_codon:yes stop_codon:yes gene_type:complete